MPTVVQAALTDLHTFSAALCGLLADRPTLATPGGERADWFDRKAALLERVGATTPEAAELAAAARERASQLRRGGAA
ncbi:hypothetical protein [Actinoplanes teichomyceticus]|uniref:hypothetical protein n=1 Tax=Actinoplanes teichomyceticus TaxID=1867 RepID=UPI0011EA9F28|nr:hypothetical protein [Actinoplanes teichomyceticus]GIF15274.1 hypothetical protein Ate01nite_53060 [Actinoplanes teichomyceticus]